MSIKNFINELDWYYQRTRMFLRSIERWIAFRTYDKYHVVKTDLKPDYYDKDTILLHANFSLLVDFVEIEKASMQHYFSTKKERPHWFSRRMNFSSFPQEEKRRLGLEYLDWEINCEDEHFPVHQKQSAKEVKELYLWWKDIRPNRIDPFEKYAKELDEIPKVSFDKESHKIVDNKTAKEKKNMKKIYNSIAKLEQQYDKEDEQMLIRLIKIRKTLWT